MQSFAEGNTWIVTQIQEYPRRRVLDVLYIAGHIGDVLSAYRRIIDFACEQNCTLIRANGRLGWAQFVKEYGWTVPAVVYHKEID
jgi:effector-binding domain-containing protein